MNKEKHHPRVEMDLETVKWFKNHIGAQTTVSRCKRCGLYYKPSLGHKPSNCKVRKGE